MNDEVGVGDDDLLGEIDGSHDIDCRILQRERSGLIDTSDLDGPNTIDTGGGAQGLRLWAEGDRRLK